MHVPKLIEICLTVSLFALSIMFTSFVRNAFWSARAKKERVLRIIMIVLATATWVCFFLMSFVVIWYA